MDHMLTHRRSSINGFIVIISYGPFVALNKLTLSSKPLILLHKLGNLEKISPFFLAAKLVTSS